MSHEQRSTQYKLWEKATVASNAAIKFLPDSAFPEVTKRSDFWRPRASLLAMFNALKTHSELPAKDRKPKEAFQKIVADETSLDIDYHRLVALGEAHVVRALRSGYLRAFAFEVPRRFRDDPVEIEIPMLRGRAHLRWHNGTLKTQGMQLIEVRFISNERANKLVAEWRNAEGTGAKMLTDPSTRAVGRPSSVEQIFEAFEALLAFNKIDYDLTMRSHYPIIRQWLATRSSGLKTTDTNPTDETIRRVVSPHFKAHKAKSTKL
jgi:hypothetical protein